jgi:hypothetical protein
MGAGAGKDAIGLAVTEFCEEFAEKQYREDKDRFDVEIKRIYEDEKKRREEEEERHETEWQQLQEEKQRRRAEEEEERRLAIERRRLAKEAEDERRRMEKEERLVREAQMRKCLVSLRSTLKALSFAAEEAAHSAASARRDARAHVDTISVKELQLLAKLRQPPRAVALVFDLLLLLLSWRVDSEVVTEYLAAPYSPIESPRATREGQQEPEKDGRAKADADNQGQPAALEAAPPTTHQHSHYLSSSWTHALTALAQPSAFLSALVGLVGGDKGPTSETLELLYPYFEADATLEAAARVAPALERLLAMARALVCLSEFRDEAVDISGSVDTAIKRMESAEGALKAVRAGQGDAATLKLDLMRAQVDLDEASRALAAGGVVRARRWASSGRRHSGQSGLLAMERLQHARKGTDAATRERKRREAEQYEAAKKVLGIRSPQRGSLF